MNFLANATLSMSLRRFSSTHVKMISTRPLKLGMRCSTAAMPARSVCCFFIFEAAKRFDLSART